MNATLICTIDHLMLFIIPLSSVEKDPINGDAMGNIMSRLK